MQEKISLLILEDSVDDYELILLECKRAHLQVRAKRIETFQQYQVALTESIWDIVIADYALPSFSGMKALEWHHQNKISIPFIMLSGKIGEEQAVEIMRAGAKDVIFKQNLVRLVPAIQRDVAHAKTLQEKQKVQAELMQKITESEERFRTMYTHTPIGIAVVGLDFVIQKANKAYCNMLGYQESELIGKTLNDITYPDDLSTNLEKQKKLGKAKINQYQMEKRFIHKDGHLVYGLLNACLIHDSQGNPAYFMGNVLDISKQKDFEKQLQEREVKYRFLVENQNDVIVKYDLDYRLLFVNHRYCEVFGKDKKDLIGKNFFTFIEERFHKQVKQSIERLKQPPYSYNHEEIAKTVEGKRWYWWSNRAILDENGNINEVIAVGRDITDIKKAKIAIQESEERFRAVIDNIPDPFLMQLAANGAVIDANKAALEQYGYTSDEIKTLHIQDFNTEDQKQYIPSRMKQIYSSGKAVYETEHKAKNGSRFPVENHVRLFNYKGKSFLLGIYRDISERKKMTQELFENEIRYHQLFNHMGNCVAIYKPYREGEDFLFEDVNRSAEKNSRIKREEVIGKKVTDVFPNIKKIGLFKVFQQVWKTGLPQQHPLHLYKDNRHQQWVENYVFKLPSGKIVAIYEDTSEIHLAMLALKKSEAKYKHLFEETSDPNLILDGDTFLECNEATLTFLGFSSKKEIIGKKPWELSPLNQPDGENSREKAIRLIQETIENGHHRFEWVHLNAKGNQKWIEITLTAIPEIGDHYIYTMWRDISLHKKTLHTLSKREYEYEQLFQEISSAFAVHKMIYDANGKAIDYQFIRVNRQFEKLLGIKAENIVGKTVLEMLPKTEKYWIETYGKVASTGKNISFENFSGEFGKYFEVHAYCPQKGFFATSFYDVTKRCETELELQKSEEKFRTYIEYLPEGLFVIDSTGKYIDANNAALEISGYSREELLQKRFFDLLAKNDLEKAHKHFALVQQEGSGRGIIQFISKNGKKHVCLLNGVKINDQMYLAFTKDITDLKLAQDEIRKKEAQYRLLAENSSDLIILHDSEGNFQYISPSIQQLTGYSETEYKKLSPLKNIYSDDLPLVKAKSKELQHAQQEVFLSYRILTKAKQIIWLETRAKKIFNKDGSIRGIISTSNDITSRKQAEVRLKESEEKYKHYIDFAPMGIFIADANGNYVEVNKAACKICGYTETELIGMNLIELIAPEDVEKAKQHFSQCQMKGKNSGEISFIHKNGEKRFWVVSAVKLSQNRYLGFVQDTTERRKLEDSIAESEHKYRSVVDHSLEGIFILQGENCVYANPAVQEISGYQEEDIKILKFWEVIHPDDLEMVKKNNARRLRGEMFPAYDFRFLRKDGIVRWITLNATKMEWKNKPAVLCFVNDVTKRKKTELYLQASEAKFRNIFDHSAAAMVLLDPNWNIVQSNSQTTLILGYNQKDLVGQSWLDFIDPEEVAQCTEMAERLKQKTIDSIKMETRFFTQKGELIWGLFHVSAILNEIGNLEYCIAQMIDITEQKKASEKIEKAYTRLQEAEKIGKFASFIVDIHSQSIWWSENVNQLFGRSGHALRNSSDFIQIVHPEDRQKFKDVHQTIISDKRTQANLDFRIVTPNQELRYIHSEMEIIQNEKGEVIAIKGTDQDVTDLKKAHFQIELDLQEKNVLLKEIHHRVKNNLAIIASLLRLQLRGLTSKDQIEHAFQECNSRIQSMTLIHEKLYQSGNFAKIDYKNYMVSLITNLMKTYAVEQKVDLIFDIEPVFFDIDTAIPLGLILNEAVTNALKYAYPKGQTGTLKISLKQNDPQITLAIQDNGVGIPESIDIQKTSSLGLRLIQILSHQLQGTCVISRKNGTRIEITFERQN